MSALEVLVGRPARFDARNIIASEGDPADRMIVMLSGWAACCKTLRGSERRIVGFLVPGDYTPAYSGVIHRRLDTIWALTRCEVAELDCDDVERLARVRPAIGDALRHGLMLDLAVSQEWLVNLGGRSAERRLAHLLCELFERLRGTGLAGGNRFALPLTQATLGAALGLSPAHINRTLQSLRAGGLASFEGGWVTIDDPAHFKRFAGFDPRYLDPGAPVLG